MCLPIIAGIAPLLSGVVSGIGGAMQAKNQAAQYKGQERMAKREGQIEQERGAYEGARTVDQINRTQGAARAGMIANGVGLTGSSADVIQDSATEGALDVAAIRWNSNLKVENSRFSAEQAKRNAKSASASAPLAFISPVISGAATYAGSFAGR